MTKRCLRAREITSVRLMTIIMWTFTDFCDNEKCVTKRNNQAVVQVSFKILTCVFQYWMKEKNVPSFRNSDKCRDAASCAKPSLGSGCPWTVTQLELTLISCPATHCGLYSGCVCCLCRIFPRMGVCSCVHSLRLSETNMEKSSHTTPNGAAVPTPHRV